jgi:hypothetical protein
MFQSWRYIYTTQSKVSTKSGKYERGKTGGREERKTLSRARKENKTPPMLIIIGDSAPIGFTG